MNEREREREREINDREEGRRIDKLGHEVKNREPHLMQLPPGTENSPAEQLPQEVAPEDVAKAPPRHLVQLACPEDAV